jgi:hypothetical protein
MDELAPASTIHFFDTSKRRIACGVSGLDHRSTKHPRQVTCRSCIAALGERPSLAGADAGASGAPA